MNNISTDNSSLLRIKELLHQRNWTIYRLAKRSGLPISSINNLFKRNTEPTIHTLRKICNGFGISLSEFFMSDFFPDEDNTYNSRDEKELIELYRLIKEPLRRHLITYAYGLAQQVPPLSKNQIEASDSDDE